MQAENLPPKVRVPPHSKESEMMVLGSMLTKINSMNIAADALDSKDFYYVEHQIVFNALKTLFKQDKPADILLVSEELKRADQLKKVNGMAYLITLSQYAGTSAYVEEYVELILSKSILRRLIEAAQEIERQALEEPADAHGFLDDSQAKLFAISQTKNYQVGVQVKDVLSGLKATSGLPYLKELEDRQANYLALREKGEEVSLFTGIPTGFHDLDKMINGLAPSNLIIFAGRPGMGKTALALNIAAYTCFKQKLSVGIFSLEMSAEQLIHRLICSESEVESSKILTGSIEGSDYQRVHAAVKHMEACNMIIDDQPGLKISDLRARARRLKEAYQIDLLIVDYLQLLSGSSSNFDANNRHLEISEISRMLKNLARELNIPLLCGAQLSRKVEDRTGKRPMMSDLRESGSIEQDADIVMLLLRKEYYDEAESPGLGEIIVGKNRHGNTGTIKLTYRKEFAQFVNHTGQDEEEEEDFIG